MKLLKRKLKVGSRKRKKKQKKSRKHKKDGKISLAEVDKELYEIQISDLTAKLRRIEKECDELRKGNKELKENYQQLAEDRADIIAYLKRVLHTKTEEVEELQERIFVLQQVRETEQSDSEEKYRLKQQQYETMKDNLTSQISLISQKLKTLDDFRVQREELLKKFEQQEERIKNQELSHKEQLLAAEKEHNLKIIAMKEELDEKMQKFSIDCQRILESKIDNTTKITMKENRVLSDEVRKILDSCKTLLYENNFLKTQKSTLRRKIDLIKRSMETIFEENSSLKKVKKNHELNYIFYENEKLGLAILQCQRDYRIIKNLNNAVQNLQMELNASKCQNNQLSVEIKKCRNNLELRECDKCAISHQLDILQNIIRNAKTAILQLMQVPQDKADVYFQKNLFLTSLLNILEISTNDFVMPQIESVKDDDIMKLLIYKVGNLGIFSSKTE